MTSQIVMQLKEVPLFADLPDRLLAEIERSTREISLEPGDMAFSEGARPHAFFRVLAGQVKLAITSDEGDEKVIEIYGPGRLFGLSSLFSTAPRISLAQATMPTRLLSVGKAGLSVAMGQEPELMARMLTHLADRECALERDIAAYCFHSSCRRVVDFLLQEAGPEPAEGARLELPMTKKLMAARLGLTPESLSRALRDLSDAGLIAVRGKHVTLCESLVNRHRASAGRPVEVPAEFRNRRRADLAADRTLPGRPVGSRAWM